MKLAPAPKRKISIVVRYTATITILVIGGMSLLAFVMLYNQSKQNDQYIHDFGQIISSQLAASAVEPLFASEYFELEVLINNFSLDRNIVSAGIFSNKKERITSKGLLPQKEDLDFDSSYYILGQTGHFSDAFSNQLAVHISPITFQNVTAGYAVVVFSKDLLVEQFHDQLYILLGSFIFVLIIVVIAGIYLGRQLSNPIRSLVDATESIREGKIDQISERRNDEIGALIDSINNMSQGLIRKTQVEDMLDKFLTKDVASKVMDELDSVKMAG